MVFADILVPADFRHEQLPDDHGAIDEAVAEILERINAAKRPVLIVGYEVHRFQLRDEVIKLAERWNVPVASSFLGRGVFPTLHPLFVGTYLGVVSPAPLRETIERSDCVLLLGELISDISLGHFGAAAQQEPSADCHGSRCIHRSPSVPEHSARASGPSTGCGESTTGPVLTTRLTPPISCRPKCSNRSRRMNRSKSGT